MRRRDDRPELSRARARQRPTGRPVRSRAAGLDRRVAGRSLVPQLGRQPHPPRVPQPPHGRGRRDPGAGLELPPGERGHHLLPLHLLQHHQHQRGRLRGGPARRCGRSCWSRPRSSRRQHRPVRHQPAGGRLRHQRPVRGVRGRHGRGPGGRQLRHGERAVRARRHVREHLQRLARASAARSRPPSSARRRSSPASASSASSTSAAPNNPDTGEPVGLTLFGTFSRSSGSLQDPGDDKQLYRYITGGLLPTDGACSLAEPAREQDLLRQHQQPGRHAVLPVVGSDRSPAGRLGHHRGGLHLRRAGVRGRLPGRRLRREAGGHQRRPHHPGRSHPDGQRREQDRHA